MSDKEKEVPEYVWNEEDLWDWQRFLIGLPDAEVERIADKVRRTVQETYRLAYHEGYCDGTEFMDREIKASTDLAYEAGHKAGVRAGWEDCERDLEKGARK